MRPGSRAGVENVWFISGIDVQKQCQISIRSARRRINKIFEKGIRKWD
jgi:exonuclease VII small subunit